MATTSTNTRDKDGAESPASQLGLNRLGEQLQGLASAMADRGVQAVTDRLGGGAQKMAEATSGTKGKAFKNVLKGDSMPMAAVKAGFETIKDSGAKGLSSIAEAVGDAFGGDKDKKLKFINIVEELDLPVPRAVAYQAWTQFEEFPTFMKKVENVEQQDDQTVEWKAQIFWSHRSWTAEIVDQVPNERIVWRSKGEKGHVDGAVTFHELTPDLTRMLVNLEYYPQGLFERTGNLWRAQARRARLELKFFRRYITSEVLLHQDEVEGWPGEIHNGDVTAESSGSNDQDSSKDQDSERGSASAPAAKRPAKKSAPSATTSSRSRPATKKSSSNESSPSRPAQPRRSRRAPHRQAAEPRPRSRRPRPREAGRDHLWQRLKYRTRSKAHTDSQQRAQDSQRSARIRELEEEVERFRRASEDALSELDWCIGYLHGSGKKRVSASTFKKPRIHPHATDETGGAAAAQPRDRRKLTCITARTSRQEVALHYRHATHAKPIPRASSPKQPRGRHRHNPGQGFGYRYLRSRVPCGHRAADDRCTHCHCQGRHLPSLRRGREPA